MMPSTTVLFFTVMLLTFLHKLISILSKIVFRTFTPYIVISMHAHITFYDCQKLKTLATKM